MKERVPFAVVGSNTGMACLHEVIKILFMVVQGYILCKILWRKGWIVILSFDQGFLS